MSPTWWLFWSVFLYLMSVYLIQEELIAIWKSRSKALRMAKYMEGFQEAFAKGFDEYQSMEEARRPGGVLFDPDTYMPPKDDPDA